MSLHFSAFKTNVRLMAKMFVKMTDFAQLIKKALFIVSVQTNMKGNTVKLVRYTFSYA